MLRGFEKCKPFTCLQIRRTLQIPLRLFQESPGCLGISVDRDLDIGFVCLRALSAAPDRREGRINDDPYQFLGREFRKVVRAVSSWMAAASSRDQM